MNTWRLVISYTARGWTTVKSSEIHLPEKHSKTTQNLEAEKMRMVMAETDMSVKSVDSAIISDLEDIEERLYESGRPRRFIMFGLGLSQPNEVPSQSETLLLQR